MTSKDKQTSLVMNEQARTLVTESEDRENTFSSSRRAWLRGVLQAGCAIPVILTAQALSAETDVSSDPINQSHTDNYSDSHTNTSSNSHTNTY
jgi:hypothetical protein